jgi:PAS domain S-box-containing protein
VPVDEGRTDPTPYLDHVPERDVTTTTGRALTLMDPATMLKQMMLEYGEFFGPAARIVSLTPLNRENLPDPWEQGALAAFDRGEDEVLAYTMVDEQPYLRLMRPLHTLPGCLKCHGQQSFKVGAIAGGVGILLPLAPYLAAERDVIKVLLLSHGGIWLLMLGGIGFADMRIRVRLEQRHAAETALREAEERTRLLLDSTAEAIYGVDLHGVCTFCNPACLRMLGYANHADLMGKKIHDIIHHTNPDGTRHPASACRIYRSYMEGREIHVEDEVFWRADGTAIPVEYWSYPVRRGGQVVGAVVTFLDISLRRQAEEAQRKWNAELEQRVAERTAELTDANRELETFSYSVSHDLRAPLRAIDGFSHLLDEEFGTRLDDKGRGYLRRVRAGAQRMGELIDALLELSRLSRRELTCGRVDLSRIAAEALRELAEHHPERRTEFRIEPGLVAEADPVLIKVVLDNLFDNAWKFTAGRTVTQIEFGSVDHEGRRAYFVRDNGAGFDMAYVGRLFGAFQRLHPVDRFPGSGIGLASVARIIHRHGGRVWAQGQLEQGATFYFTLGTRA